MRIITAAVCIATCLATVTTFGEDKSKEGKKSKDKAIVYVVRNSPANEVGRTVQDFFKDSETRVITDVTSNVLLIQTPSSNHERVVAVLEQLDRAPSLVKIQVHLLKANGDKLSEVDASALSGSTSAVNAAIKRFASSGRIRIANRIELTAIESQKAHVQVGESIPVISGSSYQSNRGPTHAYRHVDVGTILSVQTTVAGSTDVVLDVDFEKSEVPPAAASSDDKPSPPPPGVSQLTQQTTLRMKDGFSVLASTFVSASNDGTNEAYLVIAAEILKPGSATAETASTTSPPARTPPVRRPSEVNRDRKDVISSRSRDERYKLYFNKIVEKYDTDGDQALNAEERSKMSKDCSEADADGDGLVTAIELTNWSLPRR